MRKSYYMHFRVPHDKLSYQPGARGGVTLLVFNNADGELTSRPRTWIVTRASCSPFDVFSRKRGRSIAEDRAIASDAEALTFEDQPTREQLIGYATSCWVAAWEHSMVLQAHPHLRRLVDLGFDVASAQSPPCPDLILRPKRGRKHEEVTT